MTGTPPIHEDLVIDINVFIGALKPGEARQVECVEFLRRVHAASARGEVTQRQPPLFVLELFAVMNRTRRDLDVSLYPEFRASPLPTKIEPFTEEDAHALQTFHALVYPKDPPFVKGGDLEYLAVARKYGATLITCESERGLRRYDDFVLGSKTARFATVLEPRAWLGPRQHSGSRASAPGDRSVSDGERGAQSLDARAERPAKIELRND